MVPRPIRPIKSGPSKDKPTEEQVNQSTEMSTQTEKTLGTPTFIGNFQAYLKDQFITICENLQEFRAPHKLNIIPYTNKDMKAVIKKIQEMKPEEMVESDFYVGCNDRGQPRLYKKGKSEVRQVLTMESFCKKAEMLPPGLSVDEAFNFLGNDYYFPKAWMTIYLKLKERSQTKSTTSMSVQKFFGFLTIDLFTAPQGKSDGIYKNVMIIVDGFTGYTLIRPLSKILHSEISTELIKIFMDFDTPHTVEVWSLSFLKLFRPVFQTVLVQISKAVKIELRVRDTIRQELRERVFSCIESWMVETESPNWAVGCYLTQYSLNRKCFASGKGKPIEAVFGCSELKQLQQDLDYPSSSSDEDDDNDDDDGDGVRTKTAFSSVIDCDSDEQSNLPTVVSFTIPDDDPSTSRGMQSGDNDSQIPMEISVANLPDIDVPSASGQTSLPIVTSVISILDDDPLTPKGMQSDDPQIPMNIDDPNFLEQNTLPIVTSVVSISDDDDDEPSTSKGIQSGDSQISNIEEPSASEETHPFVTSVVSLSDNDPRVLIRFDADEDEICTSMTEATAIDDEDVCIMCKKTVETGFGCLMSCVRCKKKDPMHTYCSLRHQESGAENLCDSCKKLIKKQVDPIVTKKVTKKGTSKLTMRLLK